MILVTYKDIDKAMKNHKNVYAEKTKSIWDKIQYKAEAIYKTIPQQGLLGKWLGHTKQVTLWDVVHEEYYSLEYRASVFCSYGLVTEKDRDIITDAGVVVKSLYVDILDSSYFRNSDGVFLQDDKAELIHKWANKE